MQAVLEINFGGVKSLLKKNKRFSSPVLKQIEVVSEKKTCGQLEIEVKTYRMRF